ncbi:MAG: hypothetical protein KatS3mg015_2411 [Fimbriimonadales bacterium]|nr:MAG: hypothetical protein KatS3mg015_2411 [Fimbriimonadales bacterium]
MDLLPGIDLASVLVGAVSGLVGAVLTFLATRRQHEVSERSVYIAAVEGLTASLRAEIERVNEARRAMKVRIEALEQRIAELEARERALQARIDELERERDRLRNDLRRHINGNPPEETP